MKRILVVDDDVNICELVQLYFEKEGYTVEICHDGEEALLEVERFKPHAVILDLMLPGRDGYEVCREIRHRSEVPIIMLTARGETLDKIIGLEMGADDYLAKPFEPKELIARVKAVLRRTQPLSHESQGELPVIEYKDLRIDKNAYAVEYQGQPVDLTRKELELLYFLASHPNRVFTREQLLGQIWGYDFYGESRTVDVHVKRLREKLEPLEAQDKWSIKTVWGVGYKFEADEERPTPRMSRRASSALREQQQD